MKSERVSLWAVNANGDVFQLGAGRQRVSVADTRAIVAACDPNEAKNEVAASAFRVGIRNATKDEPAEISISGEIGDAYTASDARSLSQFLRANKGKPVRCFINSGGGLAWDGIAMHNAMKQHDAETTSVIESIAGSAATLPAVAASKTQIYENAQFFIHRAAMLAYGNRDAMHEAIDWLDAIDEAIAATYKAKTNKAMDKIRAQMAGDGKRDGTVFMARDAVAERYCNEVLPLKNMAKNRIAVFDDAPRTVELARAMRERVGRNLFVPANSAVAVVERKPKADSGPMYSVGTRVQVMEDGVAVARGEVRCAELGWCYDVMGDNGQMLEGCCEDDLMPVSGGMN